MTVALLSSDQDPVGENAQIHQWVLVLRASAVPFASVRCLLMLVTAWAKGATSGPCAEHRHPYPKAFKAASNDWTPACLDPLEKITQSKNASLLIQTVEIVLYFFLFPHIYQAHRSCS